MNTGCTAGSCSGTSCSFYPCAAITVFVVKRRDMFGSILTLYKENLSKYNMKDNYLLTLKAEDRPGLLHLITGVLNRKLIPIKSLTAAPTDIHTIVLITIEIEASDKALQPLLYKLENIIEVFDVEAIPYNEAICQRSAYYQMSKAVLSSPQATAISKWGAQIVNMQDDTVLLAKSGSEAVIRRLYNELEGPYLLGFSQTGVIADSKLITHDDIERIIRLAA
jgi:acetolactate synthase small subunit